MYLRDQSRRASIFTLNAVVARRPWLLHDSHDEVKKLLRWGNEEKQNCQFSIGNAVRYLKMLSPKRLNYTAHSLEGLQYSQCERVTVGSPGEVGAKIDVILWAQVKSQPSAAAG
jgi:hypothetical protein